MDEHEENTKVWDKENNKVWDERLGDIIEQAVNAADKIILDGSDGSEEETNYLTAQVALKMVEKSFNPFLRDLLSRVMKEKK